MNSKRNFALLLLLLSAAMLCATAGANAARLHAAEGSGRHLLTRPDDEPRPEPTKKPHDKHDHDHDHDHDHHKPTEKPYPKPTEESYPKPTRKEDHDHDHDDKVCWGEWYDYKKLFIVLIKRKCCHGQPSAAKLCEKYGGKLVKVENNSQQRVTKLFKKCHVYKAWVNGAPHCKTGEPGACLFYTAKFDTYDTFDTCKSNGAGCGHGYKEENCYEKLPTLCVKYKKRW